VYVYCEWQLRPTGLATLHSAHLLVGSVF
jgi:hypothetical protein